MGKLFAIQNYQHLNATTVLQELDKQVGMLQLTAIPVADDTGSADLLSMSKIAPPGHHFKYSLGFQAQPQAVDGNWTPRMSFNFGLSSFKALHTLLQQIKDKHASFLAGRYDTRIHFDLGADSDELCFKATYTLTDFDSFERDGDKFVEVRGDRLRPLCGGIEVYVQHGETAFLVGHLSLKEGLQDMTGLILEAERINALIEGQPAKVVRCFQRLGNGPRTAWQPPALPQVLH